MFTRKHYKSIATIIGNAAKEPSDGSSKIAVLRDLISQFTALFTDDNTRFDKEKFKEACWSAYRN